MTKQLICLLFGHKPHIWNKPPAILSADYSGIAGFYGETSSNLLSYNNGNEPNLKINLRLCDRCNQGYLCAERQ